MDRSENSGNLGDIMSDTDGSGGLGHGSSRENVDGGVTEYGEEDGEGIGDIDAGDVAKSPLSVLGEEVLVDEISFAERQKALRQLGWRRALRHTSMGGVGDSEPRLITVRFSERYSSGRIETIADESGISHRTIDVRDGSELPDLNSGPLPKAIVVLGSEESANDASPMVARMIRWMRDIVDKEIPLLAICFGAQLLTVAEGGKVDPLYWPRIGLSDQREEREGRKGKTRGLSRMNPTGEGAASELLDSVSSCPAFRLNSEGVAQLPPGARLLAEGDESCPVEVFQVGRNAFGVQNHSIEVDGELFKRWLREEPKFRRHGVSRRRLTEDFERASEDMRRGSRWMLNNFLRLAGLLPKRK